MSLCFSNVLYHKQLNISSCISRFSDALRLRASAASIARGCPPPFGGALPAHNRAEARRHCRSPLSLRKEKRLLTTWRRSAGRGRFRRNGFEETVSKKWTIKKSIHGLGCVREIDHGLYSAAERRRFGSYVTADSLVHTAKNVQAGFGSTKRFRNGTSKKHTDFVRTGDRTVWLTSCAKPRLVLGGGAPPFWLLCYC